MWYHTPIARLFPLIILLLINFARELFDSVELEGARLTVNIAVFGFELRLKRHRPSHRERASTLNVLANALWIRFQQSERRADLDKAVLLGEEALELRPPGHPKRSISLTTLAVAFGKKFEQSEDRADLDRAILLNEAALELRPPDHPHRPISLSNLAIAIGRRFEQFGDIDDLDRAVRLHVQAHELRAAGHPDHPLLLTFPVVVYLNRLAHLISLAVAVRTRFERLGHRADLNRVVLLHEQALELCPPDHPCRPMQLNNLLGAMIRRLELLGDESGLDRGSQLLEEALRLHPPGHPDRPFVIKNMATTAWMRFEESGDRDDLDAAIRLYGRASNLLPSDHRPFSCSQAPVAAWTRCKLMGEIIDFPMASLTNTVIQTDEQVLKHCPPGHPEHMSSLSNLVNNCLIRYEQQGILADLDRSILLLEQALELCLPGHLNRPILLSKLAIAIRQRYQLSTERDELDRVILLHEQALELGLHRSSARSLSLNNLAGAFLMRFPVSAVPVDLDRAVQLLTESLELRPPGHPHRSDSLSDLGIAIMIRFQRFGDSTDWDKAIPLLEQALELRLPGHPSRSSSFHLLALAFKTHFEHSRNHTDLEQALSWSQNALQTRSKLYTIISQDLGHLLIAKFRSSCLQSDLEQGLDALIRGAQSEDSYIGHRFSAAQEWINTAIEFDKLHSATKACQTVITLLPELLRLELDFTSRLAALKRASGLVCDGAACAIRESKTRDAVELLEGGRGVFWTHTLQFRTPFDDLPHPSAQNLTNLSYTLRAATAEDSFLTQSSHFPTLAAENFRRRKLLHKWSWEIKNVRKMSGFEHFLLPRAFRELAEAAQHGPVVILNASRRLDCDAVVIKSPHSPPIHVALPNMTFSKLERLRAGLPQSTGRDMDRFMQLAVPGADLAFHEILAELWIAVAKPIVDLLGLKKSDNPTHLWWCPTSLFTFMPIHAAGIYDASGATDMFEYAISSYSPTLDALLAARSRSRAAPTHDDKLLVIIQPEAPGQTPLPGTVEERQRIQQVVPSKAFLHLDSSTSSGSVTDGSDATVENIRWKLPEASIVHFACHGRQGKDPLKSALYLYDGPLTLDSIIHQDLPNASIAFLSACHSATGDREQPDEVVHLGSAMLAAGFQSVIATMWTMRDQDGPMIAEEFYKRLFSQRPDPTRAAHALHAAVRKLRDTGADFKAWVPFIHIGV